jgi:hypothetical protein
VATGKHSKTPKILELLEGIEKYRLSKTKQPPLPLRCDVLILKILHKNPIAQRIHPPYPKREVVTENSLSP